MDGELWTKGKCYRCQSNPIHSATAIESSQYLLTGVSRNGRPTDRCEPCEREGQFRARWSQDMKHLQSSFIVPTLFLSDPETGLQCRRGDDKNQPLESQGESLPFGFQNDFQNPISLVPWNQEHSIAVFLTNCLNGPSISLIVLFILSPETRFF